MQLKGLSYKEEVKLIYKQEGLKGFTRGYSGLLARDIPGFAIYFGSFEAWKTFLRVTNGPPDGMSKSSYNLRRFFSGGMAGVITWTIAFPADSIKTKLQTSTIQMSSWQLF